jgi:hypothetical protein
MRRALITQFFACWEHGTNDDQSLWVKHDDRRVFDQAEEHLKAGLLFLKMQHEESGFQPLRSALKRALPEFGELDFEFDDKAKDVSVRRIAWSIARDGICFLRAVRSRSG